MLVEVRRGRRSRWEGRRVGLHDAIHPKSVELRSWNLNFGDVLALTHQLEFDGLQFAPAFLIIRTQHNYYIVFVTSAVLVEQVDVHESPEVKKALGVSAVPTVKLHAGSLGQVASFPCGPRKVRSET